MQQFGVSSASPLCLAAAAGIPNPEMVDAKGNVKEMTLDKITGGPWPPDHVHL